jgi:hypothetical protein
VLLIRRKRQQWQWTELDSAQELTPYSYSAMAAAHNIPEAPFANGIQEAPLALPVELQASDGNQQLELENSRNERIRVQHL